MKLWFKLILDEDIDDWDCEDKKCGEKCIKDFGNRIGVDIGKCDYKGECQMADFDNLGCEGLNSYFHFVFQFIQLYNLF